MKKTVRQQKIIEIIEKYEVDTQEALQELLSENGFDVTQATISRDIKELCLVKTLGKNGYKYTNSIGEHKKESDPFTTLFSDGVRYIDHAMNTVVIKCSAGMAQAVCSMLDGMMLSGIVGTLAGDDTIFLLTRSENDAVSLVSELRFMIKK